MRKLIVFIFPAIFCFTLKAQDTLRVMSYNLRFGELASMEEIGDAIAQREPDFVFLQECDWNTHRPKVPQQNGVRFTNVLGNRTGMFPLFGKAIDYTGGYYGIGLLSRYPIVSFRRELLPNTVDGEQRAVLIAEAELPSGKTITLVCTHLDLSENLRIAQVKAINRHLRGVKGPVILSGDMNARPESPEMEYLRKSWAELSDKEFTFSTRQPKSKIDYIYGRPTDMIELLGTAVDASLTLSDHFPIITDIVVK